LKEEGQQERLVGGYAAAPASYSRGLCKTELDWNGDEVACYCAHLGIHQNCEAHEWTL